MRVLYWTEGFWPQIGGVEVLTSHLLPRLHERGHEFAVITSSTLTQPDSIASYQSIPVYRFPSLRALLNRDLGEIRTVRARIIQLLDDFRPNLVHLNVTATSGFFWLRSRRAISAPTLGVVHSMLPETPQGRGLLDQCVRSVTSLVAVSESIRREVLAAVPEVAPRCSVVLNGLLPPTADPSPVSFDPPRLLCIGRMVEEKGFDVALAAFASVLRRFPNATLTLAGDGVARPALERQTADLGIGHAVNFPGWVSPNRTADLLNGASLVVMPSRWEEPFGLVAVEAAQMARPIVAARVGGLPEIVVHGQTGLLVDREQPEALAEAIMSLLERPAEAACMGQGARQRANALFGLDRCVSAYDALYRQVAQGGAPLRRGAGLA